MLTWQMRMLSDVLERARLRRARMDAARAAFAALTPSEREEFLVEMLEQVAQQLTARPTIRGAVSEVLRDGAPRPMGEIVAALAPGARHNSIRCVVSKMAVAGSVVAEGPGPRRHLYRLAAGAP